MKLHIDLEVYSDVDIKSAPLETYAGSKAAKIILCAYAFDDGPVSVYQPDFEKMPAELLTALRGDCTVVAWNVGFERTVLRHKGLDIPPERWQDAMVNARYAGLPGRLKDCAKIPMIGVPPDAATKSETALIKKYCCPNKEGVRTVPKADDADWPLFVEYCRKDVLTMRHVLDWVERRFPFPERERQLWLLDQYINHRGIPVDVAMARHGVSEVARLTGAAFRQMKELTGIENPNSVMQLHPWLAERGYPYDSLGKEFLGQALEADRLTPEARKVIELRLSAAKSSVKKFQTIVEQVA